MWRLLLISMLTLSIIIPEIGADIGAIEEDSLSIDSEQFTNSKTSLGKKETQRQVRIVKHKLSTLELEKLKQKDFKARYVL